MAFFSADAAADAADAAAADAADATAGSAATATAVRAGSGLFSLGDGRRRWGNAGEEVALTPVGMNRRWTRLAVEWTVSTDRRAGKRGKVSSQIFFPTS